MHTKHNVDNNKQIISNDVRTSHAVRQSVSISTHKAGVCVLFSYEQSERTAGYVVAVESDMDEMNAVFTWHEPDSIAV